MKIALNWGFDFEISLLNYQFSWSFGTKKEKENYAEITDMSKHLQKDVGVQISSTSNQDYIRYL